MDQRWVLRDPAIMYKTFPWFQGEGFDLLLEDLLSLPADQVILVEGFRLLPYLVAALPVRSPTRGLADSDARISPGSLRHP